MVIVETVAAMRQALRAARESRGLAATVGLVPTMGALHAGHLSLVYRALGENDLVVASIFVNPLQFAPTEDLARYPRTFEADCAMLERAGVAVLFAPTVEAMYPERAEIDEARTTVDPGAIATRLDGASRPGHFVGVATVVAKLFQIVRPDRAYFGQKDAAQLSVLRQMVRDLNFEVELVGCPIIREPDGLAMSSRNVYLSAEERVRALVLHRALSAVGAAIEAGETQPGSLLATALAVVQAEAGVALDYIAFVDKDTLLPVSRVGAGTLVAIAAVVGTTRLIDNLLVV